MIIKVKIWNEENKTMYNYESVRNTSRLLLNFEGLSLPTGSLQNHILFYTNKNDYYDREIYISDLVMIFKLNGEKVIGIVEFGEYSQDNDIHMGYYIDFPNNKELKKSLGYWANKCNIVGNIYQHRCLIEKK